MKITTKPTLIKTNTANTKPAAGGTMAKIAPASVKPGIAKLLAVETWARKSIIGRDDLLRAVTLGVVSGLNALFLGPPGTAKTKAVTMLTQAFADGPNDVFSTMLTKFTKPAEVFGSIDLGEFAQNRFRVDTTGFLPTAKVGILDEVFKGSSAICNSLLTLANERIFRNGSKWDTTPLRIIVGMSNEFPEDAATLAAFFDRFPIKLLVNPLETPAFVSMLKTTTINGGQPCPVIIDDADFAAMDAAVKAVTVPDDILDTLAEIRAQLYAKGVNISDRRFVQSVRLLRASAALAGRPAVSRKDLAVLDLVLWNTAQDIGTIRGILPNFQNPFERTLRDVTDEIYAERNDVLKAANLSGADKSRPKDDTVAATEAAAKALARVRSLNAKLEMLEDAIDTDEDKSLFRLAVDSVAKIDAAIRLVAMGKGGLAELAASQHADI